MIFDRTVAPQINPLSSLPIVDMSAIELGGGLRAYLVEGGTEDVVRIDVVFKAGARFEAKPLVAATCQAMLKEGTASFSSRQISETFDFYGAQYGTDLSKDKAEVSLLCQGKHKSFLMEMFAEALTSPQFPETELDLVKKRGKSILSVNLEKVQFKSRLLFSELLFQNSTYQDRYSVEAYEDIGSDDLRAHFEANYHLDEAYIVVSGKDTAAAADLLGKALANKRKESNPRIIKPVDWQYEQREKYVNQDGAIQSAIRVGTKVVGRNHQDALPLFVANMVLGGYFGSRLMQNIREEKGYTYGIGSSLNHMEYGSYLSISTEVGADVTKPTMSEITKELKRMCDEKISSEELALVRNYIAGSLVQSFDGPFATSDRLKVCLFYGLEPTYFRNLSAGLYGVDGDEIVEVSRKYLNPDYMSKAVVGKWE